jgi:hypothetical protein
MAGVADDHVFGLGPGARQLVGAADRADHVVAPLHDDRRQMPDAADPAIEVALRRKQVLAEIMRLDARQPERQPVLAERGDVSGFGSRVEQAPS